MVINKKKNNLFLVDLDQQMEGFRQFISSWIYTAHEKVIIVDPGPSSTIPVLLKSIEELGVKRVDYILLTHIHIDHAGGTGILCLHFPEAKVVCYEKAISHMINPEKLWQMSREVLGKIADVYGPIAAVSKDRISYPENIRDDAMRIEIIETPGHAAHHVNYLVDGILFAGEVAGVVIPENDYYLRIATPPKFDYFVYKESLHKTANLDCDTMCFGHYGLRTDIRTVFTRAKEQLEIWMETSNKHFYQNEIETGENIFNELLITDPNFKTYKTLPADIRKREKYFALNSIKGMLGSLSHQKYKP